MELTAQKTIEKELNSKVVTDPISATHKELSKEKIREIIAKRAAKEFKEGDVVTLGIGLPTAVANYVPENIDRKSVV